MFEHSFVLKGQFTSHTTASTTWRFMEMSMGSQLASKRISRDGCEVPGHMLTTCSVAFAVVAQESIPTQRAVFALAEALAEMIS